MLQIKNLSFDYLDTPLLESINFTLPSGKMLHIQGENGSGKSTLLKLLAGILSPADGEIHFNSKSIYSSLNQYQQNLCYIGHKLGISLALSPRENAIFDVHHGRRTIDLSYAFSELSLEGLEDVPSFQLSAGQRRRVALLRLIMTNAKIWLLDEPFVALDCRAIDFLKNRIMEHLSKRGIVVLTSHQSLPFESDIYMELCL